MPLRYNPWAGLYTGKPREQRRAESATNFADALSSGWVEGEEAYARSLARQEARAKLAAFKFAQAQKEAGEVEDSLSPGTASVLAEYGLGGGAATGRRRSGSRGGGAGGAGGGGVDPIAFSEAQEALHREAEERDAALRRAGELRQKAYDEHEQNILFNDPVAAIQAQEQANRRDEIYGRNLAIERSVQGPGKGRYWNPEGMDPVVRRRVDEILDAKRRGINVGPEAEEFLRSSLAGQGRFQSLPVHRQQGLVPGAGPAVGTPGGSPYLRTPLPQRGDEPPPEMRTLPQRGDELGEALKLLSPTMTVGGVESPLTRALREPVQDIGVGSEDITAVRSVQNFLKDAGHKGKNNKDIVVDGDFGGNTVHALKQFQKSAGISETGVVDAATRSAMAGAETPDSGRRPRAELLSGRSPMQVDL